MATYYPGPRARLQDFGCSNNVRFICERASGLSDPTPTTAATCNNGWIAKGDRCYKIVDQQETRAYAKEYCGYYGGQLAQIRDFEDLLYLESLGGTTTFSYFVCIEITIF
jgi:hypothetical protein